MIEPLAPPAEPAVRLRRSFVYHLHPLRVTERALRFRTTFGLGVASATLFLALAVTGGLLMAWYVPSTREAHGSVQDIEYAVRFGSFVRALHRWTGHGMVLLVLLHLARVFATGAWAGRRLNWTIGVGLLVATFGLAFTGYLLPWDQLSYWAVRVATGLLDYVPLLGGGLKRLALGGDEIGSASLVRFYALHVAVLPGLALALIALHLWRLRKDGGLARPRADEPTVPAWPHLVQREAVVMLAVLAAFGAASALVAAPLGLPADVYSPADPEKAPWYFVGLQELVGHSAVIGGFVFPAVLMLGLLLAPWLDRSEAPGGEWLSGAGRRFPVLLAWLAGAAAFGLLEAAHVQMGAAASNDVLSPPGELLLVALLGGAIVGLRTRSMRAALQAGLGVLLVALAGATLVGLCRGPGWAFFWPWEVCPIAP